MKKISFIVAIYNVEPYVERCIRSIMNQTYSKIEIVLVDDGSTDNSGKIIDKLKKEDERIIVVHKDNGGVSSARNKGLSIIDGEYVIFVDGDDYIDETYAEYFVDIMDKTKADIGISYEWYHDRNINLSEPIDKIECISRDKATLQIYLDKIGVAVWNKIYRRDFLNDNNIRFKEEYWFAEGMTFNIEAFRYANKIVTCKKRLYFQVSNPNSAVRKFNLDSWNCGRRALKYQKAFLNTNNKKIINAWNYHYREYNANILIGVYKSNSEKEYANVIAESAKALHKKWWYPLIVNINIKMKLRAILFSMFPNFMAKKISKK